jgi:hypothetical protein
VQYGAIGPEMTDDERWAIIEYLKIRRDFVDPGDACPEESFWKRLGTQPAATATAAPTSVVATAAQVLQQLQQMLPTPPKATAGKK